MSEFDPDSHEGQPNRLDRIFRQLGKTWYPGYTDYVPEATSQPEVAATESNIDFRECMILETRQDRRDCKRLQKIQTADELVFLFERLPPGPFEAL